MKTTTLRNYVDLYESYQGIRIAAQNRINPNVPRNKGVKLDPEFVELCNNSIKQCKKLEDEAIKNPYVRNLLNTRYPIYEWIVAQRGLADVRAAGLIAYIEPIERFDSVSKLWTYSGFGVMDICQTCNKRVVDYNSRYQWIENTTKRLMEQNEKKLTGKSSEKTLRAKAEKMLCSCDKPDAKRIGQRKVAGQIANFSPNLKKQVFLCVDQFVKQGDFYKEYYKECKENYMNRPDLKEEMESKKKGACKGTAHIDAMARRKVAKMFLSHLWTEWRTLEGLPVTDPYAISVLGHKDYIKPPHSLQ